MGQGLSRIPSRLDNPFRLAQVATGCAVPFTGPFGLFHLGVESEVEPFETTAPTAQFNVSRIAIGSGYDVVSDEVAELGSEGTVRGSVRFGRPHERRHIRRSVSRSVSDFD
jgi:hypothetical protein